MTFKCILPLLCLILAGCDRPGDGREAGSDKAEWSILQNLEYSHRGNTNEDIEYTTQDEYQVISILGADGRTRVWIMMDPESPPFYKQIPADQNFNLTESQLEEIRVKGNPVTTVYQALGSHRINKGAADSLMGGDVESAHQDDIPPADTNAEDGVKTAIQDRVQPDMTGAEGNVKPAPQDDSLQDATHTEREER